MEYLEYNCLIRNEIYKGRNLYDSTDASLYRVSKYIIIETLKNVGFISNISDMIVDFINFIDLKYMLLAEKYLDSYDHKIKRNHMIICLQIRNFMICPMTSNEQKIISNDNKYIRIQPNNIICSFVNYKNENYYENEHKNTTYLVEGSGVDDLQKLLFYKSVLNIKKFDDEILNCMIVKDINKQFSIIVEKTFSTLLTYESTEKIVSDLMTHNIYGDYFYNFFSEISKAIYDENLILYCFYKTFNEIYIKFHKPLCWRKWRHYRMKNIKKQLIKNVYSKEYDKKYVNIYNECIKKINEEEYYVYLRKCYRTLIKIYHIVEPAEHDYDDENILDSIEYYNYHKLSHIVDK